MKTKAVCIEKHGGADELKLVDMELQPPAFDEVTIRPTAIGLNFSDVNVRRGGF